MDNLHLPKILEKTSQYHDVNLYKVKKTSFTYEDIVQLLKDLNEQQQKMIDCEGYGFFGFNWKSLIYYEEKYYHTDTRLVAKIVDLNYFKVLYCCHNDYLFVPKMTSFPSIQHTNCFWIQVGKAIIFKTGKRFEYSKLGNFLSRLSESPNKSQNKNNKINNNKNYNNIQNTIYFI
jgi:hypothetical protein